MLKQRIMTALVLGAILIGVIISGAEPLFAILMAVTVLIASWEWAGLCGIQHGPAKIIYAVFVTGLLAIFYFAIDSIWANSVFIFGTIWWCIALTMIVCFQSGRQPVPGNRLLQYMMGCFVLLPAALSLIYMYGTEDGQYQVLIFFILIWIVDSAAYFIGRQYGKRRLADRVSPGKSWEGFGGSIVAAGVPAGVYIYIQGITGADVILIIVLFMVTAVFSAAGDLFESMFKRYANLKDSSQLLPGHGGLLDRIDSLTAAAPVFMLGLWMLEGRI